MGGKGYTGRDAGPLAGKGRKRARLPRSVMLSLQNDASLPSQHSTSHKPPTIDNPQPRDDHGPPVRVGRHLRPDPPPLSAQPPPGPPARAAGVAGGGAGVGGVR